MTERQCKCENAVADIDDNDVVRIICPDCGFACMMSFKEWKQIRSGKWDRLLLEDKRDGC